MEKPKLKKFFKNKNALDEMFAVFDPYILFVEVTSQINICRDSDDNFLLALAKDGFAEYTGDKDLLVLNPFEKTKIITISNFLAITD